MVDVIFTLKSTNYFDLIYSVRVTDIKRETRDMRTEQFGHFNQPHADMDL